MLGPCVAPKLENVSQHSPALPTRFNGSFVHRVDNGDNRLAVCIVGVIDKHTAIRTRLDLPAPLRRNQQLQTITDLFQGHIRSTPGGSGGKRDHHPVFTG